MSIIFKLKKKMCLDVAKESLGNKMPIFATEKHCFKDTKETCLCAGRYD